MLKAILCAFVLLCTITTTHAETLQENNATDFQPNIKPNLQVMRAPGEIIIDANLEDEGWRNVAKAMNFAENYPVEKVKPPVKTEAWVTYDDENLYLAFIVEDEPGRIRASMRDRDEMWQDDYAGILLDTFGDASSAFFIFANPLGIQGDSRFSSSGGEDDSFDLIYQSEGKVTDKGYQVEMAIPFRSLRFPDTEEQVWRATFWITHPRDSRSTYTWAAMDRDDPCFLCQFGTLSGIRGIRSGSNVEFLPAVTGSQSGALNNSSDPGEGFHNQKASGDFGLGMKYNFSSNLIADLALNPDFSQVEADAAQIDVNTNFALFFRERRPFFQEGSDLFSTWIDQVYTRQINNPIVTAKLTGRFNKTSIGYIGGLDDSAPIILPFEEQSAILPTNLKSTSNILRVKHSMLKDSYIGALFTDRRLQGSGSGTSFGADALLRFWKKYQLELQAVASHTEEPSDTTLSRRIEDQLDDRFLTFDDGKHTAAFDGESFWGRAIYASFERSGRFWDFDFDYWEYSPTFRADNGFETSNNSRRTSFWTGVTFWTDKSRIFERISPSISIGRVWNFDNVRRDKWVQPQLNLNLKSQTSVWVSYIWSQKQFTETDFSGIRRFMLNVNSNFSDPVKLGIFFGKGRRIRRSFSDPQLGSGTDFEAWGTIKPFQQLVVQPSFIYSRLEAVDDGEEFFDGFIFRTRLNYQFNRELALRLVTQYNNFSKRFEFDPLLTYRLNAFTAFFVGSTLDYSSDFDTVSGYQLSSRQYFLKFQYLYQL